MATYTQEYNAAKPGSAGLAQRLACAVVDQAVTVAGEGTGVSGHAQRMTLATAAAKDPDGIAGQMILTVIVVLGNAGNVTPSDADLKTTVASLWNLFAGVG